MRIFTVKDNFQRVGRSIVIGCLLFFIMYKVNYEVTYVGKIISGTEVQVSSENYNEIFYEDRGRFMTKKISHDYYLLFFTFLAGTALGLSIIKIEKSKWN